LFAKKVIDQDTTDDEVEKVLDAKYGMMDALGIN